MFRKLIPLLAAPAVVGAQQVVADPSARPISMAEAVSLAKQNNISAITATNAVRSANNQVRSTRANLYPTLTASAGQGISAGDRIDPNRNIVVPYQSKWSYNSGLSAQMTLFDGGKTFADIRSREADASAAQASQTTTEFGLALQVKTQYNAALAANEQYSAAQAQLAVAKQQLDMTVAKVNAGAANIADSLNSVVQVGNAQLAILTAQQSLRTANAALTRLAGTDYLITANPADTVDHSMSPIDSAMVMGLALDGPAIRQNQAQITSASASIKSAKTAYFPTLSLSANIQGSGPSAPYGFGSNPYPYTRGATFSLNYPIFNRFQRENQVQTAQISLANAEASLKDNKLAAQQTIATQLGLLHTAEEQVKVQQNSVRASEEVLRVNQQRYTLGAGTFLDVLTSQSSLVAARQGLIQARLNYRNARAQIEAVIGRDLP
jgi:outer membrane protein